MFFKICELQPNYTVLGSLKLFRQENIFFRRAPDYRNK